jgi:hypothetical protein
MVRDATILSPGEVRFSRAHDMAAMPEPIAIAAVPPSSEAMRRSSTRVVGFENRAYDVLSSS